MGKSEGEGPPEEKETVKCPYCRWSGSFKSFGKTHMPKKHRRIMLKNLAKARAASRKSRRSGGKKASKQTRSGRSVVSVHRGQTITIKVV